MARGRKGNVDIKEPDTVIGLFHMQLSLYCYSVANAASHSILLEG